MQGNMLGTSTGPALFSSTYTNPEEFLISTVGEYMKRPTWYQDHGLSRDDAKTIVGKWAYYRQKGAFPYSIEGRRAAGVAIARDMGKGILPATVYNVLQNAHAYLTQYHAKKYPDAQILKWFQKGEERNVGTVAAAKVGQAVRAVSTAVDAVTPWWGSSKILIPLLALGVGGYFLAQAKTFIPGKK